ncbi:hypothetical protein GUJ93_ZPchr0012g21291 [Zizania palustris]|uniref:Protein TIC 22, chloroplastic n=1 Tax=Zizania palustris TaxID=103762 RepID=A0A8J5WSC1_ZIZPA|nr:hypothetical protein GUJ93_ZPchr0012g21291 [Zizania palustris]
MPPPNSARVPSSSASLPLAAAPMSNPVPSSSPPQASSSPLAAASAFLQHHLSRLASRFAAPPRPALAAVHPPPGPQGASLSLALAPDEVARALTGTPVFTVCNSSNEFVLVSDPATGLRSLGLLCFRSEDADALLTHVRTRQPMLGKGAKVVPITLDQVYMLKAEGIAFRFLPDPLQIKNALEVSSFLDWWLFILYPMHRYVSTLIALSHKITLQRISSAPQPLHLPKKSMHCLSISDKYHQSRLYISTS